MCSQWKLLIAGHRYSGLCPLNSMRIPSIAWKGYVVKAVFPEEGTVRLDEIYEKRSTSRDEHKKAVRKALDLSRQVNWKRLLFRG